MDAETRDKLIGSSKDFYRVHADSFARSRSNGWDSWGRLMDEVGDVRSVLDLGCGNGRFATFLTSTRKDFSYTGIDTEAILIAKAIDCHPGYEFRVEDIDDTLCSSSTYDFVACFGVFHHIPSLQQRARTFNAITSIMQPGALLAVSFWQPELLVNFENKVLKTHDFGELERGDHLLGWNGDFSQLRYCHHFVSREIDKLIAQSPFVCVSQFQGNGNDASNRYVLLRKG